MAKTRPLSGGPSQRQLRVAEVIRRALSDILARGDVHDPELGSASITVAEVKVSPDLRHATVFVLPLGGVNTEGVLKALTRNRQELRRQVTGQIDLKFSPELSFQPDRRFDQMDRTRELLNSPEVRRDIDSD
ncbi:30S ribosome-binding factor RbfA [Amaricoccus solimangrovi]|uniref:Ribosome-binding factor A n=1 Tax=Amaricoccus solimangrovi TaxID=2589815 RepID=A0A501WVR8_9RHOB|nr:30S ribosome-binding factor RbfA [Amaricoccus solimangrovi]TPE52224.1 30S ribosome-binding factor RbfA [Amaricoccus solimangrovi]